MPTTAPFRFLLVALLLLAGGSSSTARAQPWASPPWGWIWGNLFGHDAEDPEPTASEPTASEPTALATAAPEKVSATPPPVESEAAGLDGDAQPASSAVKTVSTQLSAATKSVPSPPPLELLAPGLPAPDVSSPPAAVGSGAAGRSGAPAGTGVIGRAIESGLPAEPPPLAEPTLAWYRVPWRWLTEGWDNHAEFGLDGSSGNARTLALQTGIEMQRKTDAYLLELDFDYRKASTTGVTTEDNGRLDIDYNRLFPNSPWTAFGKFGVEWDQFKAFDSRLNLNGGLGYDFIRTDEALFATRFGAGASKEIGAPDDSWKPEAVFGAEGQYQLNRYNKMKGQIEYFPAWEDFSDYRLVTDLAWEILLDDNENLSLKLALTDRYDSTPQGAKPNDVYYSLLLLVKF